MLRFILMLGTLTVLSGCAGIETYVMRQAVDKAPKIAKFADFYCDEASAPRRELLRNAVAVERDGKQVIIEC